MDSQAITIKDVADLLFAARQRIDFHWTSYVVVVTAVIGWLVSLKRPLTFQMKMLVSIAFLLAAVMNSLALYSAYTLADTLRTDLLQMMGSRPLTGTRLLLERHSYLGLRGVALAVHAVLGTAILLVVWRARSGEPPPNERASASPPA